MTSTDVEHRRAQLDAFAGAQPAAQLPAIQGTAFLAPTERIFGAQQVAVRRDEKSVLQKLKILAAAAGEEWYYRIPVRRKIKDEASGREQWVQDFIEGPSIKLANDLARLYGNCDVDVRVMDIGEAWVIYARFVDLESGFSMTRPFQQRKAQKAMRTDEGRAQDIALQIGVSKAVRNVVTNALQTYADFGFEEARNGLVDKIGKRLDEYRGRVLRRLDEIKIEPKRAELVVGRAAADWLAPDVARLIAMLKSIADGMASVEDTFPSIDKSAQTTETEKEVMQHTNGRSVHTDHNAPPRQPEDTTAAGGADLGYAPMTQAELTSRLEKDGLTIFQESGGGSTTTSKKDPVRDAEDHDRTSSAARSDRDSQRNNDEVAQSSTGGATPPTGATKTTGGSPATRAKAADPRAEGEYVAHAETWINALTDPAAGIDRWKREKALRNHCYVAPDVRDKLEMALEEKIANLKKKDETADVEKHDHDLAAAAKSGGAALEAAITKVPEPQRSTLKMAIERRHRPAAAAVDAAKARSGEAAN